MRSTAGGLFRTGGNNVRSLLNHDAQFGSPLRVAGAESLSRKIRAAHCQQAAAPQAVTPAGRSMAEEIITCKIIGLDKIQEVLEQEQPKKARLAMRIALSTGGGTVRDKMADMAPVEQGGTSSGFLRDHLKVKTIIKQGGLVGKALVGATNDPYPGREGKAGKVTFKTRHGGLISFMSKKAGQVTAAMVMRWLEYGTSKMAKHPFATQAWDASKQDAMDRIIAKLKEGLGL